MGGHPLSGGETAIRSICVFCGSSTGVGSRYTDAAAEVGKFLARKGIRVVYGGAHIGTMGVVADASLAAGGEVIGVIPESMVTEGFLRTDYRDALIIDSDAERLLESLERHSAPADKWLRS